MNRQSPTIADTYHGKVVPLDEAARLVQVNEDVRLTVPEHVVPFAVARDIVMEHPDHIVVLDCPCRMARENPCLPLDVCLIVGEPFASFILDHQPDHARRITPDEAVDILEGGGSDAGTSTTPSSRTRCCNVSTRSATAVRAAAVRCRRTRTASRC